MFLSATAETATNCGISTEVVMLILGAALGLIASLLTMAIQRWFDRRGKLNIFYRFSHQKNGSGTSWGFEDTEDGHKYFTVPVVYEIQNTSNTTRVIRDVSLLLYNGKIQVANMVQLDHLHITKRKGNTVTGEIDSYFGTEKGSYSFVLPPRSIQRQECEYAFKIDMSDTDKYAFDTIYLRYFDERNRKKEFKIRSVPNCWQRAYLEADEEWKLVKK